MKSTHIESSTLKFLKDIKKNNDREWFAKNKPRYQEELSKFKLFTNTFLDEMNKMDEIEDLKVFRIYRDSRFSKDKTPYKTNFAGRFKRATARRRGGYYFQIQPGGSFLAGGFWAPNPPDLKRVRQEIEMDDQPLRKIINAATFKKTFGELAGKKVLTAPRGFAKDHPAIDLLRYKQFIVYRHFTDKEIKDPKFLKEAVKTYKAVRPFFNFMSEVLTTDLNGVSILE